MHFLAIIQSYLSEATLFLVHLSMSKLNFIILRPMELPFARISSCPNEVDINIGICFSTNFSTSVYMDLIHQHYKKKNLRLSLQLAQDSKVSSSKIFQKTLLIFKFASNNNYP